MSAITYRGNLSASSFPLISTYGGRSVIIGGPDQSYVRGLQVPQEGLIDENDKGIPQILYCHNVMPSSQGFQSVGFTNRIAAIPLATSLVAMIEGVDLSTGVEVKYYFALFRTTTNTKPYRITTIAGGWALSAVAGVNDFGTVLTMSAATVNGLTYICIYFSGTQFRRYDPFVGTLLDVILTGTAFAFPVGLIKGNLSCFGYHILWNETTIAWSSLLSELDFTPSLITGAGFEKIQDTKGGIVAVVRHQLGFIIYTTKNAVSGVYTGNPLRPFIFREITGVGGFPSYNPAVNSATDLISDDANTQSQYAYSSAGLQKVGIANINVVNTDITDFISGNVMEDFNTTTNIFTQTTLASGTYLIKKLNTVLDRYLIISYGMAELTHAIIYDLVTKRMGKIKLTHVISFALFNTSFASPLNARTATAFMTNDGAISTIDFNTVAETHTGALILGKFQHTRERLLQLQHAALENTQPAGNCACFDSSSLDGKNQATLYTGYLELNTLNLRSWAFSNVGLNHTLYFVGSFYATSLVLEFNIHGRR